MIVGIGADMVEVARIEQSIRQFPTRFVQRIFTDGEQGYADSAANRFERLAARFAAKEAGIKALGAPWAAGLTWRDLEVQSRPGRSPELHLHHAAERYAQHLGVKRVLLTLTHTSAHALAFVILES